MWQVLVAVLGQKANRKEFFHGRSQGPQFADILLILKKISLLASHNNDIESAFDSRESWSQFSSLLRFLLTKAMDASETTLEYKKKELKF